MVLIRALFLLLSPLLVFAQDGQTIVYDAIHNATTIVGTWSSGAGNVQTGPGFANPVNYSFIYPKTTGISYSFTADGFFEQAEYRFNGNGTMPSCIQGIVLFQHGTYSLVPNGSIILTPFAADGRIQVEDTCAAVSNIITQFNTTVLFLSWRIFMDPQFGPKLHLFRFDGAPYAPQFLISKTPNMLPTRVLTINNDPNSNRRLVRRSSAPPSLLSHDTTRLATVLCTGVGLALVALML